MNVVKLSEANGSAVKAFDARRAGRLSVFRFGGRKGQLETAEAGLWLPLSCSFAIGRREYRQWRSNSTAWLKRTDAYRC